MVQDYVRQQYSEHVCSSHCLDEHQSNCFCKTMPHTAGAGLCPTTDSDCFSADASYITERLRNQVQFTSSVHNPIPELWKPVSDAASKWCKIMSDNNTVDECAASNACLSGVVMQVANITPTAYRQHTNSIPTAYTTAYCILHILAGIFAEEATASNGGCPTF